MDYRRFSIGGVVLGVGIALLSLGAPESVARGVEKDGEHAHQNIRDWKKQLKKEDSWMEVKKDFGKLTPSQKKRLKKKLRKLRKKHKYSDLTTQQIATLKAKKKAWRKARKKKNLTKAEIKALKKERRQLLKDFRALNASIKKDFDKDLRQTISTPEQALLQTVEPPSLFELQSDFSPNDPDFLNQWGLTSLNLSTLLDDLIIPSNPESTIVAVIDAGVDFGHEDLAGIQWTDPNCVDENGLLIPGGCPNGGYDIMDGDNNPFPDDGVAHGTGVASFIGAQTDNSLGMASAGGGSVKVMALRTCCDANGYMSSPDIEKAIRFAVNNGADIINASFGGPTYAQEVYDALDYAQTQGVLVVTSAGNYASDNDIDPIYPANYDLNNILSVGSIASWDHLAYFSNYGSQTVDLAAPGQDVWGATLNNGYGTMSGTSFSAPMVSSVLGRIVQEGNHTPQTLQDRLLSLTQTLTPLDGKINGSRVLRFAPPVVNQICGNTILESPEQCDDGNLANNDGCSSTCEAESPSTPICGNSILESPEQCDDGNLLDGDGCSATCEGESALQGVCGNNILESPEQCDDGNLSNNDGCSSVCETETAPGAICGNGIVEGFEACDDGNLNNGDGCSATCEVENTGGNGNTGGVTIPIAGVSEGNLVFHHEDHLTGSNIDTDEGGNIIQILDYYPYGDTRIDESSVDYENDYEFTGKERDDETGLLYYEARYYDSSLGRFISKDSWNGEISSPQTLNRYAYTLNNPIKYNDPSGNVPLDTIADVGTIIYDSTQFLTAGATYGYAKISGNTALANVASAGLANEAGDVSAGVAGFFTPYVPALALKAGKNVDEGSEVVDMVRQKVNNSFDLPTGGKVKGYTDHGRQQALIREGRGVDPKVTLDAANNPIKTTLQSGGKTKYSGKNGSTVLNDKGDVVTTFGSSRHKVNKNKKKEPSKKQSDAKN